MNEWQKIISVTGKPGTCKTKCLHSCMDYAINQDLKCLVATPTGFLASSYRALFSPDIDANTIHSSFHIPIDTSMPQINWSLAMYDVIIIDEISMVTHTIFNHIMSTVHELPTRAVLLISGDKFQLPPLTTDNKRTSNGINIYQLEGLTRMSWNFNLTSHHRCIDDEYCQ